MVATLANAFTVSVHEKIVTGAKVCVTLTQGESEPGLTGSTLVPCLALAAISAARNTDVEAAVETGASGALFTVARIPVQEHVATVALALA